MSTSTSTSVTPMRERGRELFEDVAVCLEYPGIELEEKKRVARRHLGLDETPAQRLLGGALANLAVHLSERGQAACEEEYTRLFDLSPVCTLHLGHHFYGDAYERGELLAALMPEVEKAGIRLEGELPDFLPVLLRLLARLEFEDDRKLLVEYLLAPGLAKIVTALGDATDPWSAVVRACEALLREIYRPRGGAVSTEEVPIHA